MKLTKVLKARCRMNQSNIDELVRIMTIHVDDLAITGEPHIVRAVLKELAKVFGSMIIKKGTFTNCGLQHVQNPAAF